MFADLSLLAERERQLFLPTLPRGGVSLTDHASNVLRNACLTPRTGYLLCIVDD